MSSMPPFNAAASCVSITWLTFYMAEALANGPRPKKEVDHSHQCRRPGVIAADTLLNGGGDWRNYPMQLARLNQLLPAQWSHNNPIDILSDADSGDTPRR
jgi:acetyltransferase